MKKFIKSFSMLCLALLIAVPVFAFAGCSKKFTISISIESGSGNVYKQAVLDANGKMVNLVGDNAVEGGSKFEYKIAPAHGYEIEKVVVDGKEETLTLEDKTESVALYFDKVDKNHNVKVYFKKTTFVVNLKCADGETFKTVNKLFGESIDLNENQYGGQDNDFWYVLVEGTKTYVKTEVENIVYVGSELTIYTDKTRAELEAIIAGLE